MSTGNAPDVQALDLALQNIQSAQGQGV